jgi:hypothetical protein
MTVNSSETATEMRQSAILKPGENCWRIEQADRLSLLVDGAQYFHAFRETAKNARRSVLIIGWDIDGRFELERDRPPDGLPTRLRDFLNSLVKRSKGCRHTRWTGQPTGACIFAWTAGIPSEHRTTRKSSSSTIAWRS